MDEIIRAVSADGLVKMQVITARGIVQRAQEIHNLTPTTAAALGRTLCAASLLGALTQHKNTKTLAAQIEEADTQDGSKILGHILGGNAASEFNGLAAQTGLSANEVSSALSGIAPALLSGLSAATQTAQTQQIISALTPAA